jgi:hypothetical protein
MNAWQLQFETSAELKAFIRKRNITHGKVNTTDIILTAVLTAKDIEVACKDYNAKVVGEPK